MNLLEVQQILEAEVITGRNIESVEILSGCGADLMSDVLCHVESGGMLLTGLTSPQVVRTAEMANLSAVCFIRGKRPLPETIELAESMGIPLLVTGFYMLESCGRLYKQGLPGCRENQ